MSKRVHTRSLQGFDMPKQVTISDRQDQAWAKEAHRLGVPPADFRTWILTVIARQRLLCQPGFMEETLELNRRRLRKRVGSLTSPEGAQAYAKATEKLKEAAETWDAAEFALWLAAKEGRLSHYREAAGLEKQRSDLAAMIDSCIEVRLHVSAARELIPRVVSSLAHRELEPDYRDRLATLCAMMAADIEHRERSPEDRHQDVTMTGNVLRSD